MKTNTTASTRTWAPASSSHKTFRTGLIGRGSGLSKGKQAESNAPSFMKSGAMRVSILSTLLVSALAFAGEVSSAVISTNGLIAYYPFDGNANDQSVNANHGTVNGAALTTDRFGNPNSAYSFNGSSNYISAPNQSYLSFPGGDFTISFWEAIASGTSSYPVGMSNGGGELPKWLISYGLDPNTLPNPAPGRYVSFHANYGGNSYWSATALYQQQPNDWHHFTFTKSGTNYSLFIDGAQVSGTNHLVTASSGFQMTSNVTSPSVLPSGITAPLTIGQAENGGFFNGKLDDIVIYNRALSANEVQSLYSGVAVPEAGSCGLFFGVTILGMIVTRGRGRAHATTRRLKQGRLICQVQGR